MSDTAGATPQTADQLQSLYNGAMSIVLKTALPKATADNVAWPTYFRDLPGNVQQQYIELLGQLTATLESDLRAARAKIEDDTFLKKKWLEKAKALEAERDAARAAISPEFLKHFNAAHTCALYVVALPNDGLSEDVYNFTRRTLVELGKAAKFLEAAGFTQPAASDPVPQPEEYTHLTQVGIPDVSQGETK